MMAWKAFVVIAGLWFTGFVFAQGLTRADIEWQKQLAVMAVLEFEKRFLVQ